MLFFFFDADALAEMERAPFHLFPPATPALSSVKFDLIFFPVLGYFPTEMKG